jgi:hypothetical protein
MSASAKKRASAAGKETAKTVIRQGNKKMGIVSEFSKSIKPLTKKK